MTTDTALTDAIERQADQALDRARAEDRPFRFDLEPGDATRYRLVLAPPRSIPGTREGDGHWFVALESPGNGCYWFDHGVTPGYVKAKLGLVDGYTAEVLSCFLDRLTRPDAWCPYCGGDVAAPDLDRYGACAVCHGAASADFDDVPTELLELHARIVADAEDRP